MDGSTSGFEDEWSDDDDFLTLAHLVLFPKMAKRYRSRMNHFTHWTDGEFHDRFRLSKECVRYLAEKVRGKLQPKTMKNRAVSVEDKILYALRFYSTGNWLITSGDFIGIHKSTGSRIVRDVSAAIASLAPKFINFPTATTDRKYVAKEFYDIARFPRCIGAIDCTHVRIQSPGGPDAEIYRNRKDFFSLNVQAVVDARGNFEDIVCRWPGSTHDSMIFRHSRVHAHFEADLFEDFVLVGDSGYGVRRYMLTPLTQPANQAEDLYNEAQIRTRNPVERTFGRWKRRFPGLAMGLRVKLDTLESIVVATAVLHNIATHFGERAPRVTSGEIESIALTNTVPLDATPEVANRWLNPQEITRCKYIEYFNSRI